MTGHHRLFPTRWNDNDQYAHVNNVVYYEAMDTTINSWLLGAGLVPAGGTEIALCVSSSCEYHAPLSFPDVMRVGLRAGRLGSTSVTWELTIHRVPASDPEPPGPSDNPGPPGEPGPLSHPTTTNALSHPTALEPLGHPAATGRFVHVFVNATTRRPVPIPPNIRAAIERDLTL